jgi:hypothetical protein
MGNGTYQCVSEQDLDYNGVVRYYDANQIQGLVQWEQNVDRMFRSKDDWWATRRIGEVLHYDNGFGQFVRGVVVLQGDEKKLKPTALVGRWGSHELPKRRPNGEIYYPYHANKVVNQPEDAAWQPSESCVFENPRYSKSVQRVGDPRRMKPIDLSVPDMTPEQQAQAKLEQAIDRVRDVLENRYQTSAHPREVLESIKELVDAEFVA